MTLVDLLKHQTSVVLPSGIRGDGRKDAFLRWLSKAIDKLIQQKGAFFRKYELLLLEGYWREQRGTALHEQELVYKNPHIDLHRYHRLKLIDALRKFHSVQAFHPEGARRAELWFLEDKGLERYLRGIVTQSLTNGVVTLRLLEPYSSVFQRYSSAFRQPLSNHVVSRGDV